MHPSDHVPSGQQEFSDLNTQYVPSIGFNICFAGPVQKFNLRKFLLWNWDFRLSITGDVKNFSSLANCNTPCSWKCPGQPKGACNTVTAADCTWMVAIARIWKVIHEIHENKAPNNAATPQCQSQFTPKMKANVEPRLLSSLVWIDSGIVVSQHRLESFFMK